MNYRHAFHAGNFADVFKHAILARVVDYLRRKDKPFVVLDTHAGIGDYDFPEGEAARTGEYREGIARLLVAAERPLLLAPYIGAVEAVNAGGALRRYPGSPRLIRTLLRPGDRLVAVELHSLDAATLAAVFAGDRQVKVHHLDGYLALKAFLPPRERRGLVLVDPPFEEGDEFDRLADGLAQACRRWARGVYALWYPIKDRAAVRDFHARVAALGIEKLLIAELTVDRIGPDAGLGACGMLLVNPPWLLETELRELLPFLAKVLGRNASAGWRLDHLASVA